MSDEQLDALVARYTSDETFAQAMNAATSPDEAVAVAADNGFDVTADELVTRAASRELSDAELENATGGLGDTYVQTVSMMYMGSCCPK